MFTSTTLIQIFLIVPAAAGLYRHGDKRTDHPECPRLFAHKFGACDDPLNHRWKCIRKVNFCDGIVDCLDAWDENPVLCRFKWDLKPLRKQRATPLSTVNSRSDKLQFDKQECPSLFGQKQRSCPSKSTSDSVKCIRWTDLCNGIADCPDGHDELPSSCISEEEF